MEGELKLSRSKVQRETNMLSLIMLGMGHYGVTNISKNWGDLAHKNSCSMKVGWMGVETWFIPAHSFCKQSPLLKNEVNGKM